ncbi:PREDICTED: uncharacterized protein LOC109161187 [Ipomoea nil]|uniref:uncharacterized protein LOC109161187 n=1 Tax=Ipomoea nil TaxID=35883 RepID=UPI000901107A|nr:PREDICTED: uncharacterized protein LOC109161187 [Ipomoea nil]
MKKNKHLLLPSLQRKMVSPPGANPGTNNAVNSATLGEKSFGATPSTPESLRKNVLLPSLWKPVAPPSSNPGTNSALVGAMNFVAGLLPRKTTSNNLLLPPLQWRPVTPPSTNPGHNSIGTVAQRNYAGGKTSPLSIHHQPKLPLSQTANC